MQDKNWLLARIENPALLEKGDEARLREIIADYPAFAHPYLLLAKRLHEMKHSAFDDLLPVISLRAYDRKKLFHLVHEIPQLNVSSPAPSPREESIELEEEPVMELPKSRFAIDFQHIEKEEEEIHEPEEIKEIPFGRIREDKVEPFDSAESLAQDDADIDEVEPFDSAESLAQDDAGIDEVEPFDSAESLAQDETDSDMTDITDETVAVESEKLESNELKEEVPVSSGDFFSWLNNLSPIETEHIEAASTKDFHEVESDSEMIFAEKEAEEIPEPDESMLLIEKFIETQPSITRVKNEFFNPVNQAKASEQESDELVTETIAKILVKQEKFEKAIQTYEKLQLKYPQKFDYFAALILELKEKIK